MTTQLPRTVSAYIRAVNDHDAAAFNACFSDGAVVDDAGREFRGITAIKDWSEREIIEPKVTLGVLDAADRGVETVVTTKVDGNYDKTGLPDPFIVSHHIVVEGDKIARLTIRLAGEKPGT